MATIITDELRLLIKAEAAEAVKELGSYKAALAEIESAQKAVGNSSDAATSDMKEQNQAMKEAKKAISDAEDETKTLAGSLSSAGKEAGKQTGAIKDSSAAHKQAGKSSAGYATGLKQVDNAQSVVKVGAVAMGKAILGALAPIAIVLKTMQLIKDMTIDANAAYAESEGEARKFSITYRDVAEDAEEAAKYWADTFKYAESTAMSVLGSAGDMYTGMGMSGEAALKLAERTTYLGGALSKLNPQIGSASEATKALITATTGEREALKTWGIIISEAAIQTKLLERGQKDLTGAALLNAKAQATLDIAYEQSPNALAAVTSATELAADTNRELSETWKEFLELQGQSTNKFFQPMKKALSGFIQDLNDAKKAQLEAMEINPNTELIEQYGKTADRIEELTESYEMLKEKTSLSTSEQADLKTVMAELADLVPTSVTAWNDYGEAIGVSTAAAKEFADQQRELRLAEAEYQLLRLQNQQRTAKATYETNKNELASTIEKINAKTKEINTLGKEYEAARNLQILMADNTTSDYGGAIQYIRENAALLKDTRFSIEKLNNSSMPRDYLKDQIDAVIFSYSNLNKELQQLQEARAKYALDTKEYDVLTAQIKQAEAELVLLTGSLEEQISVLEYQVGLIPKVASNFEGLKRNYDNGTLSATQYELALRHLIAASKESSEEDPTPDLTKWNAFVEKLTNSNDISKAINMEVELSPIIDPDNGRALLSEKLDYYQDLISQLWKNKDAFSGLDEWKTALEQLGDKYDEVKAKIDANTFKDSVATDQQKAEKVLKKTIAEANELRKQGLLTEKEMGAVTEKAYRTYDEASGKTKLRQRAQELIGSTLTEQQAAMNELLLLETELRLLEEKGLVTEGQSKAILEAKGEALAEALGNETKFSTFLKESLEQIQEEYLSFDAIGSLITDTFSDIGSALASGESVLEASGKALGAFASNLMNELSTMAIGAGLRVIAEGGWAGLPIAMMLFALGGVAGIGGGFFGSGGGKGLDSSISDTLSDEIKLRQSLNEALEEQLGIEETLLKRQLDRNLISEEDYRDSMQAIQQEKNQGEAQSEALGLVNSMIGEIDTELSSMSGWKKFWSGKDEDLKEEAAGLEGIAKAINTAVSAEELKVLIAQLESYGIDTSSIPAFAKGGSFITSGESIVRLGDNFSGRELVNITPLGSAGFQGGQPIVVNINGPVIGYEDLYQKLGAAGIKLKREKRVV